MNHNDLKFNLNSVPPANRLSLWARYVHLSQMMPRSRLNGNYYIHQSKSNPNQYALKISEFFDSHYKQLTVSQILETTVALLQTSTDQKAAKRILDVFKDRIKIPLPPALSKVDASVEDKAEKALRSKIDVLLRYLAPKKIYGSCSSDLRSQFNQLVQLLKTYWKSLHLPGVYENRTMPEAHPSPSSFLAELDQLPPQLMNLYSDTLKEKFGNPKFLCYFQIHRQKLSLHALRFIEQCFREAVLEHLKAMDNSQLAILERQWLRFNHLASETVKPDPLYQQTFEEYLLTHPVPVRQIDFAVYQEGLFDIIPYCKNMVIFNGPLLPSEAALLVKRLTFFDSVGFKLPQFNLPVDIMHCFADITGDEKPFLMYYKEDGSRICHLLHKKSYRENTLNFYKRSKILYFEEEPIAANIFVDYIKQLHKQIKDEGNSSLSKKVVFQEYHEKIKEVIPYVTSLEIVALSPGFAQRLVLELLILLVSGQQLPKTLCIHNKNLLDAEGIAALAILVKRGSYRVVETDDAIELIFYVPQPPANVLALLDGLQERIATLYIPTPLPIKIRQTIIQNCLVERISQEESLEHQKDYNGNPVYKRITRRPTSISVIPSHSEPLLDPAEVRQKRQHFLYRFLKQ